MELEKTFTDASREANKRGHGHPTLEHLLLALVDDNDAHRVMTGCGVDLAELRSMLRNHLDSEFGGPDAADNAEACTNIAFDRVIERSIFQSRTSSGRKLVTGADVLAKLFLEHDSRAVRFLHQQGMNRLDAVAYISHFGGELAVDA